MFSYFLSSGRGGGEGRRFISLNTTKPGTERKRGTILLFSRTREKGEEGSSSLILTSLAGKELLEKK